MATKRVTTKNVMDCKYFVIKLTMPSGKARRAEQKHSSTYPLEEDSRASQSLKFGVHLVSNYYRTGVTETKHRAIE